MVWWRTCTIFSGENDEWLFDDEKFKNAFFKYIESYIPIDNLNERIQGNSSVSNEIIFQRQNVFEGYKTSLFIIKYLFEKNGINYILEILKDNEKIRNIGNSIIDEMVSFYKDKYDVKNEVKR